MTWDWPLMERVARRPSLADRLVRCGTCASFRVPEEACGICSEPPSNEITGQLAEPAAQASKTRSQQGDRP